MSQFDPGGFGDFRPAGPAPGSMAARGRQAGGVETSGIRDRPPAWVPDASCTGCQAPRCGTQFETFQRRHHCRYCGGVFCDKCSSQSLLLPPQWEGLCGFATRDPQRVCDACALVLQPKQREWIDRNCNANRSNRLEDDATTRYLNSPLRFTLGGEVRKAGYALRNLTTGVNYWERDAEYFDAQLQGARGLLFLTVAKVAFIGGVKVGTGLVVARLPDGSWSAPCAVGCMGFTFGAAVGAEVTDAVTALDEGVLAELCDTNTTKLALGGEVGFAFGPVGRTAAGDAVVSTDASAATATSYSQSRGLYGGVTVDGAYLKVRDDVNLKFYGRQPTAADLLRGREAQPPAAQPLYEQLQAFYADLDERVLGQRSAPRYATGRSQGSGNFAAPRGGHAFAPPGQDPFGPPGGSNAFDAPPGGNAFGPPGGGGRRPDPVVEV
mmetsp:Transcript_5589/g.16456  ORF Transcript_5589/g.16456 Transcript_5589/m.16456 type:complete len:437 (-) Transcript_5589:56-1366(-)